MKIQSLTLYLTGKPEKKIEHITDNKIMLQALDIMLGDLGFDLNEIIDTEVQLPTLVATYGNENAAISLSYSIINEGEGLLVLSYQKGAGKQYDRHVGQISRGELVHHLELFLSSSVEKFISTYFPPKSKYIIAANALALALLILSLFGFITFALSELLIDDVFANSLLVLLSISFIISAGMLTPRFFSKDAREFRRSYKVNRLMLIGLVFLGNIVLSCGLMLGGMNLWHWATSNKIQESVVFGIKSSRYSSKRCNGSIRLEGYSGSLCLNNKYYWSLVQPGMIAIVTGSKSTVGLTVKSIDISRSELK